MHDERLLVMFEVPDGHLDGFGHWLARPTDELPRAEDHFNLLGRSAD
jgi:hypothetical protein